jgi:chemotaxis protein MotB
MPRKRRHEQHEDHIDETWLVPYSDILTLLLALFIVLFASAQIDNKKFEKIASSFNSAFSGIAGNSVFSSVRTSPAVINGQPQSATLDEIASISNPKETAAAQEAAQLSEIKRRIDAYIVDNHLETELSTVIGTDGLMVRIKDTALFPSGSAALLPESQRFATMIAKMLKPLTQQVIISGHTDNVPINTAEFPSNWDLSAKRALNFMKFLLSKEELSPELFSAIGYGEFHPVASNDTPEGRAKNRRVEIVVSGGPLQGAAPVAAR